MQLRCDATDAGYCDYADAGYDCDGVCLNDEDQDGICDEFEVAGCTDNTACNFSNAATDTTILAAMLTRLRLRRQLLGG